MKPKKLILSRKGFDSTWDKDWFGSGGCPSPIFRDGTLCSLPIPDREVGIVEYRDLCADGRNIGKIVNDLTKDKIPSCNLAHLDPDINPHVYPRQEGWRPLFGQSGIAQRHLRTRVQPGDVFLFFGLFQRVEEVGGRWRFAPETYWQHVLWGWLQIEEIHKVDELAKDEGKWTSYHWAHYHPHLQYHPPMQRPSPDSTNTLYIASDTLDLVDGALGAGRFPKYHERLVLTDLEQSPLDWQVTRWCLPRFFYPDKGKTPLTYHPPRENWHPRGEHVYVQRKGQGQEFVLDLADYPEATDWLADLVRDYGERPDSE